MRETERFGGQQLQPSTSPVRREREKDCELLLRIDGPANDCNEKAKNVCL